MLPVLILYIDRDYQITYWIVGEKIKIVSPLNIAQALQLLNNVEFDLIVSDPLHIAILRSRPFEPSPTGMKSSDETGESSLHSCPSSC